MPRDTRISEDIWLHIVTFLQRKQYASFSLISNSMYALTQHKYLHTYFAKLLQQKLTMHITQASQFLNLSVKQQQFGAYAREALQIRKQIAGKMANFSVPELKQLLWIFSEQRFDTGMFWMNHLHVLVKKNHAGAAKNEPLVKIVNEKAIFTREQKWQRIMQGLHLLVQNSTILHNSILIHNVVQGILEEYMVDVSWEPSCLQMLQQVKQDCKSFQYKHGGNELAQVLSRGSILIAEAFADIAKQSVQEYVTFGKTYGYYSAKSVMLCIKHGQTMPYELITQVLNNSDFAAQFEEVANSDGIIGFLSQFTEMNLKLYLQAVVATFLPEQIIKLDAKFKSRFTLDKELKIILFDQLQRGDAKAKAWIEFFEFAITGEEMLDILKTLKFPFSNITLYCSAFTISLLPWSTHVFTLLKQTIVEAWKYGSARSSYSVSAIEAIVGQLLDCGASLQGQDFWIPSIQMDATQVAIFQAVIQVIHDKELQLSYDAFQKQFQSIILHFISKQYPAREKDVEQKRLQDLEFLVTLVETCKIECNFLDANNDPLLIAFVKNLSIDMTSEYMIDMVELLTFHGDINVQCSKMGRPALYYVAASRITKGTIKNLLTHMMQEHKASPLVKNHKGKTVLQDLKGEMQAFPYVSTRIKLLESMMQQES